MRNWLIEKKDYQFDISDAGLHLVAGELLTLMLERNRTLSGTKLAITETLIFIRNEATRIEQLKAKNG